MGDVTDDIGAYWAAYRANRQAKRTQNRGASTAALVAANVPFTSHSNGAHLIVDARGVKVDFWPATGLWRVRGETLSKRGVQGLLALCEGATA